MKNMENKGVFRNPGYHETKRHTDTMFAFNIYPCTLPSDQAFVPLHWHDSMEIIYIKKGRGIVQADHETYAAEMKDVFLISPGHLHSIRSIPHEKMEYENIIFDMSFLGSDSVDLCSQKYLLPLLSGSLLFPFRIEKSSPLYPAAIACLNAADQLCSLRPEGYELGIKGQMMILLSLLIPVAAARQARNDDDKNTDNLKTVLSRIERDYNKKLTVNEMSHECGYSESHFMRWFKNITGTSFTAYLIEYRLNKAAQALRSTGDSVLEISEKCGFDNLSNFNRLFKKRFEMTPKQFRKSGTGYFSPQ